MDDDDIIENIIKIAKSYIGKTYWARHKERRASNNINVCFEEGEWKCNLFVYEVILEAGYDIGCPHRKHFFLVFDHRQLKIGIMIKLEISKKLKKLKI